MNSGSYPYYPAAPAKKKSKAPIIILVAVLVLAAIGLLIVNLTNKERVEK